MTYYVLECAGLYIKIGGFTNNVSEAAKFESIKAARHYCNIRVWVVKKIVELAG